MTDHPVRLFHSDDTIRRIGEGVLTCTLPRPDWTHEAHLAACAWLILERPDIVAERDLPGLIRRYNESVGGVNDETQGYHETITQVSILAVRRGLARAGAGSLHGRVNHLLLQLEGRRDWPLRFYSPDLLFSTEARMGFVAPDLAPLPGDHLPVDCGFPASISQPPRLHGDHSPKRKVTMADLKKVKPHMEIVGADGVHVGTVDRVKGNRIKMTKQDSGSHSDHHHYISGGLVATVEGDKVRLSANADAAVLLEEEEGREPIMDESRSGGWSKYAIGAAVLGAAAAGAYVYNRRKNSPTDTRGGETEVDVVFEPDTTITSGTTSTDRETTTIGGTSGKPAAARDATVGGSSGSTSASAGTGPGTTTSTTSSGGSNRT